MKKSISVFILLLCVGASLFANGAKESQSAATDSGEKVVIKFWTEDRHDLDYVQDQIKQFNDSHENIDIDLTVITENFSNMLTMAYSAGTAPDIASVSASSTGFDLKTFADGGLIVPLTDYIDDPDFQLTTDPYNNIIEGVTSINGQPYWIPTALRAGVRMIYNQNLLDEIGYEGYPTTLKELMDLSDELTAAGNGNFYGLGTTSSAPIVRWFEGACQMSGIIPYDFANGRFDFDGFKEPIEICQQIFINNSIFPGSPTQGVDAMRAQFAEGTFGIWANASQEAGVFTEQFPITNFDWVVKDVPTVNGEIDGTLGAAPQKGYLLFSSSKHPEEAWEVIKFLSSENFLIGYLEGGYALPNTEYMASVIDKSKLGRTADWSLKSYEGIYPASPVVSLAGEAYSSVLWQAVMNQVDVDKAISDLNTRYNDALDRDVKMGKIKRIVIEDFDPKNPSKGTITYLDK